MAEIPEASLMGDGRLAGDSSGEASPPAKDSESIGCDSIDSAGVGQDAAIHVETDTIRGDDVDDSPSEVGASEQHVPPESSDALKAGIGPDENTVGENQASVEPAGDELSASEDVVHDPSDLAADAVPRRMIRDSVTEALVDLSGLREGLDDPLPPSEVSSTLQVSPPPSPPPEDVILASTFSAQVPEQVSSQPPPPPDNTSAELADLKSLLNSEAGVVAGDDVLLGVIRVCDNDAEAAASLLPLLREQLSVLTSPQNGENSRVNPTEEVLEWVRLTADAEQAGDKEVTIDSNEIGITVENVLERTVVHLVKEGSAAQLLGVSAGALLLAVHDTPTHVLSHFETVDALKRAPRPARLRFRPLPPDLLSSMRDRMHTLVVQRSTHAALVELFSALPTSSPPDSSHTGPLPTGTKMRFCAPPLGTHNDFSASEQQQGVPQAAAAVCEWACDQVHLALLLFTVSSEQHQPTSSRGQQQRILVAELLKVFQETLHRSPTRGTFGRKEQGQKSSSGAPSHGSRIAALSELINNLVFGVAVAGRPEEAEASADDGLKYASLDWCSSSMRPMLMPLLDVACALLAADCDLPLLYPSAAVSIPPASTDESEEEGGPWVLFDAAVEPVLSDGAMAALVVVLLRAYAQVEGDDAAACVATPLTASLASARCERARIAACRLALETYPRALAPERLLLRGVATRLLVQSPEPTLRAAAVTAIQRLGKVASLRDLDWLILLCDTASSDSDTIVRRGGFEFSLRILHRLPDIFSRASITFDGQGDGDIDLHLLRCKLVAVVQRLVEDPVASVRHAVAAHCASLCTLLGGGNLGVQWSTWIVDTLHTFLRDDDGAVRAAAIDAVPFILTLLRGFAHRYVYHAYFGLKGASPSGDNEAPGETPDRGLGGADTAGVSPSNNVVPWGEVESLISACYAKMGPSDSVVSMAVASVKRTAGMLLPALVKLSHEAPEDVRCKVAAVAGRLVLQIRDEFSMLALSGWGQSSCDTNDVRWGAWKTLRVALTQELIGPLLLALMSDAHRPVVATLFTEMAGLPQSFTFLEPEGGAGVGRRGQEPMSSVFVHSEELVSVGKDGVSPSSGPFRCWTTVEIMPESLLGNLVSSLEELSRHRDWRHRAVAVRGIPAFAPFTTSSAMQDRLSQVCVGLLCDKVNSVRLAAAEALSLTALIKHNSDAPSIGGEDPVADWNESIVIPQLYNLMQRPSARERQLALYMIQILVSLKAVTPDVTIGVLVPLLLNASQDVVSNVRLAVAKTLNFFMSCDPKIATSGPAEGSLVGVLAGHQELERCLQRLSEDEDHDVNHEAQHAMTTFANLPQLGKKSEDKEEGRVPTEPVVGNEASAAEVQKEGEDKEGTPTEPVVEDEASAAEVVTEGEDKERARTEHVVGDEASAAEVQKEGGGA